MNEDVNIYFLKNIISFHSSKVRSELVTSIERVHGLYFVNPNRHGNQLVLHKA